MTNLLNKHTDTSSSGSRWKDMARWKRVLLFGVIGLLLIAIALGIWGAINIKHAKNLYNEALAAKDSFTYAQVAVGNQDFELAKQDLEEARVHFENAKDGLARFKVYKILPGVARQIKAVENVIDAGINLSNGMIELASLGEAVFAVIDTEGDADISIGDIDPEAKRAMLKELSDSKIELQAVKSEIELAVLLIEEIPEDGLMKQVKSAVEPIKQQLPLLEAVVDQVVPLAQTLPTIAGYPNEKTYLFLLQNNRELRPTGGFIGTYGIVELADGEIARFDTDNIYNLDNPAADHVTEPSPEPISRHTTTQNWLMRNINWSPDFPTTAKKAEEKYFEELEIAPETNALAVDSVDGVIAVTPTFIESLLTLTGPITVGGLTFDEENLFETLQHQVEFAYYEQGISDADRKEIVGDLASKLMDELFALEKSQFPELWTTFVNNVDQKQILIYLDDPITQRLVVEQNWAGEMKPYTGDFLMFVDANLAALKTDNVMERELTYNVTQEDGTYYGEARMLYRNTAFGIDGFHTRYRTHTRIYLPQGAELVGHSGFLTGDKLQNGQPTDPEVYDETFERDDGTTVTYTVVAGFIAIEPKNEGTLQIKYKLPNSVGTQIDRGEYELYVQKQAGTVAHTLRTSIDVGRSIKKGLPNDAFSIENDNKAVFDTTLLTDREISVNID